MRLLTLDFEATGTDPKEARIVQFFAGVLDGDKWLDTIDGIVNPGVEIPAGAVEVHGITNERARVEGMRKKDALVSIREFLSQYRDLPFVIMNARYDVVLLNSELSRNKMRVIPTSRIHFIDPLVIDRGKDRYRKGKRKLENLAEHYGVPFNHMLAHDAAYDCLIAGQVAAAQIGIYGMPTNAAQAKWHREWAEHYEEYLRGQGDAEAVIERGWPE